ncbi:MAG: tetratricopeptide repeat protein [bacterium]|nr:tetratricopeptide repeat protein [bacterium]
MRRRILGLVMGLLALLPAAGPAAGQTAMREKVYEKLSKAQEAAEAQDWDKAYDYLGDVERMRDLDGQEKAQLWTAYGYTYFAQEEYTESATAYAKVLELEEVPEALRTSALYTLGQLHFHLEHYDVAAGHLESWLTANADPGPEAHVLLGQAYYQLDRPEDAAASIRQAVAINQRRGKPVQENWYALLRVIYFELEDYDALLDILETLVMEFPAKEYWVHLSSAYGEMGDEDRQLAAYEMAHVQGYLTNGSELVLLAQLLMRGGVPYRAGVVLEAGLDSGTIENTARHWRLLSQAWTLAQEHQRAIESLTRAAELSDDGELDALLAQSYANLGQWEQSVDAATVALRKGVDEPHELQMMQGMALFELGRLGDAREAFAAAQGSADGRETATRWLVYLEREEARLRELGIGQD